MRLATSSLAASLLLALACSGGAGSCGSAQEAERAAQRADAGDEQLIVPAGLSVKALAGGNGVLSLFALTLQRGARGIELFAALRNEGSVPACGGALSVELFDKSEQSMASGIGSLLTSHFYRRIAGDSGAQTAEGLGTVAACVPPGEVTMAAVNDLPSDLALEEVAHVVYRCPYFALDVARTAGLAVKDVQRVAGSAGTVYKGELVNELDVAVKNPSAIVFAITRAGRPLDVAMSSSSVELAPGESFRFETASVRAAVDAFVAFPMGEIVAANEPPSTP